MPDLKSELSKVINSWETPAPAPVAAKPYFSVTNNVTRVTFNYVRDNPGKTRVEIAKALEAQGFKSKSVASLLGQMMRQEMLRENGKLIYTNCKEYTPIKSSKVMRARAANPVRKKITIVNTRTGEVFNPRPAPVPAPVPVPVKVEKEWEPKDVIDKLTVRQAIALFKELRNILVG
jgi:hypothetical protein